MNECCTRERDDTRCRSRTARALADPTAHCRDSLPRDESTINNDLCTNSNESCSRASVPSIDAYDASTCACRRRRSSCVSHWSLQNTDIDKTTQRAHQSTMTIGDVGGARIELERSAKCARARVSSPIEMRKTHSADAHVGGIIGLRDCDPQTANVHKRERMCGRRSIQSTTAGRGGGGGREEETLFWAAPCASCANALAAAFTTQRRRRRQTQDERNNDQGNRIKSKTTYDRRTSVRFAGGLCAANNVSWLRGCLATSRSKQCTVEFGTAYLSVALQEGIDFLQIRTIRTTSRSVLQRESLRCNLFQYDLPTTNIVQNHHKYIVFDILNQAKIGCRWHPCD